MSSPSLPMVPQWLILAFGVRRALTVLLAFEKNKALTRRFGIFPVSRQAGKCYLPFSAFTMQSTIPFSSLSWFSLLHIDEDVEEPGTSENPTRSFEIHNIGSHIFWRL